MERVISARIDDATYRKINDLSQRMHTSKKEVIETAIRQLGQKVEEESKTSVFDRTCGVWVREETIAETTAYARKQFGDSMTRFRK